MAHGRVFNAWNSRRPAPRTGAGSAIGVWEAIPVARIRVLRSPDYQEWKQTPWAESEGDHGRHSQNVKQARERPSRRAQLQKKHCNCRGEEDDGGACADPVLRRNQPGGENPPIDPLVLIGDRASQEVCQENENATDAEREEPVHISCVSAGGATDPRAVRARVRRNAGWQSDRSQRRSRGWQAPPNVPRDSMVTPCPTEERQQSAGRYEQREDDEPGGLRSQQRPICLCTVSEVRAGEPMTDPEQRGQAEVERWSGLSSGYEYPWQSHRIIGASQSALNIQNASPSWTAHPRRWQRHRVCSPGRERLPLVGRSRLGGARQPTLTDLWHPSPNSPVQ